MVPIVSGLSLNNSATILQGAIPAAMLAICVQLAFDLLDRVLIPEGNRFYDEGIRLDQKTLRSANPSAGSSRDAVRPVLHDHPDAGDRRQPGPQEARAAVARDVPRDDAALRGAARQRHRDRRRADVLPGAQPRADRRAPADGARDRCSDGRHAQDHDRSGIRRSSARAVWDALAQAAPAHDGEEPGHVRRRGRQRADDGPARRSTPSPAGPASASSSRSRSGSGSPCCSPTSPKRWRRGAARRRRTRCARRGPRPSANRLRPGRAGPRRCPRREPAQGRRGDGEGRRVHPGRRRDHRRRRVGRRVGDHRRVGAGHPRVGRRPLGGDRRHARAVGLDQGPRHRRSGPHVPRSDDRARRRRRAAEDAERDRAQHPAGRPDDHLPAGGRDAAAVRDLLGRAAVGVRAGRRCWSA